MPPQKCPNCGEILSNTRAGFCEKCGSAVVAQKLHATGQDNRTQYQTRLTQAWSQGKLSADQAQDLADLRSELGIDPTDAEQLKRKAIESLRPARKDDLDDEPRITSSEEITLSVNTNQFYMEGFSGVIDAQVQNLSNAGFDSVKMEVSGNLLDRAECSSFRVDSGQSKRRRFQIKQPTSGGVELIQFRVITTQGASVKAFWAETTLIVLPKVENVKDIQIQADNLVNLGQASEKFNIGGVIDLHIDEMIKHNKIKTAYDFMVEYSKLAPHFETLELELDPERSEQLTESVDYSEGGKRVLHLDRGSLADAASLKLQSNDVPVNILLIAKPTVSVGRARTNDIVTRILPRSKANDTQSCEISAAAHCQIVLTENGLFVEDSGSANGTALDNEPVTTSPAKIADGPKGALLELGGVLSMAIKSLACGKDDDDDYERAIDQPSGNMWKTAAQAKLNSMTLTRLNNLGAQDENGCESYCLLYRAATIGSTSDCSISFSDKGLEPLHAAVLYFARRFYLENRSDLTDVVINDTTLSRGQLMPLSFGDDIRIARLRLKFVQRSQLFVDVMQT